MKTTPQTRYALTRLAQGRCRNCGGVRLDLSVTRCETCREKDRTRNLARYHARKCSTPQPS